MLTIVFYSELQDGARSRGGQKKRYKDLLKTNLRKCDIQHEELEALAMDRYSCRAPCKDHIERFEVNCAHIVEDKQACREVCGLDCVSRICLFAYRRIHHTCDETGRVDGSLHLNTRYVVYNT